MSAEEPRPSVASRRTKPPALGPQLWDEGEEEDEKEVHGNQEPKTPSRSSSDESEESEAELPPAYATRRKVSFADAFGLDLVSVKEFDTGADSGSPPGLLQVGSPDGKRYRLFRLFAVPSSNEELVARLRQNKLEVESVEFLPNTTTIRGVVRVLNLSYHKSVYVRITLDGWGSHFDLLAEYVPGSSDGETDRFSFRFTLMPPFRAEGAWVEFCLRYESSTGTFWANNGGANYVLLCQCREERDLREKGEREKETEENNHKWKKSCLKAVGKWNCVELKSTDVSNEPSEPESLRPIDREGRKTQHEPESCPSEAPEETRKALAERRSRRKASRLAQMQEHFSQNDRAGQLDQASPSKATEAGLNVTLPAPQLSAPVKPQASNEIQVSSNKEQNGDPAPIRSYLQSKHTTPPDHADVSEIGVRESPNVCEEQLLEDGSTVSCADAWEAFLNGMDRSDDRTSALGQEGSLCTGPFPSHTEHDPSAPGDEAPSSCRATRDAQESMLTGSQSGLFGAVESQESDRTAEWSDSSKYVRDGVLDYECTAKPALASKRSIGQESETAQEQWGLVSNSHPSWETTFGEDVSLLATKPRETARTEGGTGLENFKAEGGVSPEVAREEKVKRDVHRGADDGLAFVGVRDMLFPGRYAEGGATFQRQHTSEEREPKQEKEHIREENNNTAPLKEKTRSKHSEVPSEALERRKHAENKEPTDPRVQTTEALVVSVSERGVFEKEEFDTRTECLDLEAFKPQGEEEAVYVDPIKDSLTDTSERPESPSVEIEAADWNCESSNTMAESQAYCAAAERTHGREREGNVCTDSLLGEEPCSSTTTATHEPPLALTSRATCGLSGPFGRMESASESDPLLLPASNQCFECSGETMRHRETQDQLESEGERERAALSPRTAASSVGKILLVFCSLGFVSRALVYAALVVILITAYLHNLPVCLAIYLLSVCWWCGQGMKKQVVAADSVD
ncbi:uncharacterized protein ppp1r3aa isoform X1 [Electrophorus electricus]|uniref:CBM21 domain-containing protein n=1 Tax=Electrophorus electricus TaxID=8005 RepID=A0AAY5ENL0_ELEEL|nr:uncharacterized protein ppp1r3aa isoform X1 [Electrophorus electricus]